MLLRGLGWGVTESLEGMKIPIPRSTYGDSDAECLGLGAEICGSSTSNLGDTAHSSSACCLAPPSDRNYLSHSMGRHSFMHARTPRSLDSRLQLVGSRGV